MAQEHPVVVGVAEILRELGVTRSAFDQWQARRVGFPEPRWTVHGMRAWDRREVAQWHQRFKAKRRPGREDAPPPGEG